MQSYEAASAHITALTQCNPDTTIVDVRMIHDVRKDVPAIPMRGVLPQLWSSIQHYQSNGYGCFININDMDGSGHSTENVRACRVAVVDLDNEHAQANFDRACAWSPAPQFYVQTSPGRFHVYWQTSYYAGNDYFTLRQRKLRQWFDGDKSVIDPTRVLRLAGTLHLKRPEAPHLVTIGACGGWGAVTDNAALDASLAHVNVIDGGSGTRHPLGDPALSAPSLAYVQRVLDLTDPNTERDEWVSITSAIKQSAWLHADEATIRSMWDAWCTRYDGNNPAENDKLWRSIRDTEVGWPALVRRRPELIVDKYAQQLIPGDSVSLQSMLPEPPPLDCSGEILTAFEQREYFKGHYFVVNLGKILTDKMRFLSQTAYNGEYNGKKFIIDSEGKTTKSAWEAAIGGTEHRIPALDHIRFLPSEPFGKVIEDSLGRKGINIYKPAKIIGRPGDPSRFLRHIGFLLPDQNDQKILLDYLAHNIKYPGHKIPWAPVIQSAEGAGKGIIKHLMDYCIGDVYTYPPNAKELTESGAKFNAWMRAKLFILCDEIKVDDKRDMIEVLKPLISEDKNEIQGKGVDQDKEDNFANWLFFTNYKDAVPINQNSRRFCIFYSAFQSVKQLEAWGLTEAYFNDLYGWMKVEGSAIMYDYFINHYPLERGAIPMRAPNTSSTPEVLRCSMSASERIIYDSIEDNIPGFRGGWLSDIAVRKRLIEMGNSRTTITGVHKIINGMGYVEVGRAPRFFIEEDPRSRATLFNCNGEVDTSVYGVIQGYR